MIHGAGRRHAVGLVVVAAALVPLGLAAALPAAPAQTRADEGSAGAISVVGLVAGDDWSLPAGTPVAPDSGFFSEGADPGRHVDVHVVDVTWRMLEPAEGEFRDDLAGRAQDMDLAPLADQLAVPGRYWLRVWLTNVRWAPRWVVEDCGLAAAGNDEDGGRHLPIWNACFWGHAVDLYRHLLVDLGIADDPDLVLAYVPGGFAWAEFDFDVVDQAVAAGDLTVPAFVSWFHQMVADLTGLMGDQAGKLVYTGEDHPFASLGTADDLLARYAVEHGMGVRTGISELSNFHLNEVPAYGTTIGQDGHLVTDEDWVLRAPGRISAAEHECYLDCGFHTDQLGYAIRQSNLHALAALRTNWLYVVPHDSYLDWFAAHWSWVRHSLGQTAATSADAWVALRRATDEYWADDDTADEAGVDWNGRPVVHDLERWVHQLEQAPGCHGRRGSEVHVGVLAPENGVVREGRRTDAAAGQPHLCFSVDDTFLAPTEAADLDVLVTYVDRGRGSFVLTVPGEGGRLRSPEVALTDTGRRRTVRFNVAGGRMDASLPGGADLRLTRVRGADVDVQLVRVVRP